MKNPAIEYMDKRYLNKSTPGKLYKFWGNKTVQLLRFKILSEIDDLTNKSVLDVGCGLGEFYYFCKEKGVNFSEYVGIDINPKIVKQANDKFPELRISCLDVLEIPRDIMDDTLEKNRFDYIIASGLFNFECANWDERTWLIIEECYKISKLGVAINFLRFRQEERRPIAHYTRYRDILEVVERLTNRYVLRCDYKKNDFTVYLYKKQLR